MTDPIELRVQKMATALSGPAWNRGAIVVYLREFAEELILHAFDSKWKFEHRRCLEIARAKALAECLAIAKDYTGQGVLVAEKIRELVEDGWSTK